MGKKPENGGEETGEQKPPVASPEAESAVDLEKKNNTRYAVPCYLP